MRVKERVEARSLSETMERRRGILHQLPRREAEHALRLAAAQFSATRRARGTTRQEVAAVLELSERTLADWERRARLELLAATPRGRPLWRSSPQVRNALILTIRDLGSHTGVAPLRSLSPAMPRSEIADLLGRYRSLERRRHSLSLGELRWTTPAAVWAMDHAVAPAPLDGNNKAILAVRDLATGEPLLWQALKDMKAEATICALGRLFDERGVPLVLKSDNGPAFRSEEMREFLNEYQVHQLSSPIRRPSYNGACEASIRHLKQQTEHEARRLGRPGLWRGEDLARARSARAFLSGADHHDPLPGSVRDAFAATLAEKKLEVTAELGYPQVEGEPMIEATIQRRALSRALVEHGFLHIRRRRVPLPESSLFRAKIS